MVIIGEITKSPCIYKITSPSGRVYIGQTINFKNRYNQYLKVVHTKKQKLLYKSFIKYGVDNHTIEIIEIITPDLIDEREIFWIDFYKSNAGKYPNNKGMNLTDGGGFSCRGLVKTQEHKNKIGKANRGKKHSQETKDKLRKSAKLRGNNRKLNTKHSEETKLKCKVNAKWSRKVIDTKTLKIYHSIKEAAKYFNIGYGSLKLYLRGKLPNKTSLIYLEEYEKTKYL